MDSAYFSIFAWTFLPDMATNAIHWTYRAIRYPIDAKKPKPQSPTFQRQRRIIYTLVVLLYLAYTLAESYISLPPSHYDYMGVSVAEMDGRALKSKYKRLSLMFHPDKVDGAEEQFRLVRTAYETLNDPVKRYAYDRFGPDAISGCSTCRTRKEFFYSSVGGSIGFYIGTGIVLSILSLLHRASFGQFMRYVSFITLMVAEGTLIVQSDGFFARLVRFILPGIPIHDQITVLHQVYVTLFIAIAQVGPIWFPPAETNLHALATETYLSAQSLANHTASALNDRLEPFPAPEDRDLVQKKMVEISSEVQLLRDPQVANYHAATRARILKR